MSLEVKTDGRVATVWFNRPEKRNAFTEAMFEELAAQLARLDADAGVRVVVLSGRGEAFSAGVDRAFLAKDWDEESFRRAVETHIQRVAVAVERFEKPLLAAVNGAAVGAGLDLALMADIRIAAASARFSTGYVRNGLAPGGGCAYYLPRAIGLSSALEMLLAGDFVDAAEAERIGLVSRSVPDDELVGAVAALAGRIAANDELALRLTKRLVYTGLRSDAWTMLDLSAAAAATTASRNA